MTIRPLRYELLDHWRGFAALAVLWFHAASPWFAQSVPLGLGWFAALAEEGWRGVHLFFVISGYCIAQLALRAAEVRQSVGAFLRSRCLRIFPCYWAACVAAIALGLAALPFNHAALVASRDVPGVLPGSLQAVIAHLLLVEPFVGLPSYLLVAWSLSWEISYYLLTGLLVLVAQQTRLSVAVGLGLILSFVGAWPVASAALPLLGGWSEFACGACVYAAAVAESKGRPVTPWIGVIIALGLAGLLASRSGSQLPLAAGFALLLHVLRRHDSALARIRAGRLFALCGTMSFSLYLIHAPVVTHVRNLLARLVSPTSPWFAGVIILATAAGCAAGWLFFKRIEEPLERWRKSLDRGPHSPLANPVK